MFNTRIFSYAPLQSFHRHGFVKVACSLATLMLPVLTANPSQSFASGNVPEVSVSGGAYVIEGDPGGAPVNAVFTFSSNINPVGGSMPVRYTVSDVAGSDFLASGKEGAKSSFLLFSGNRSGQYTATINIPITADNTDESDGYIKVVLNPAANSSTYAVASTVGADTATVAVVDDDVPELTISGGSSVTEVDPGGSAVNATFTVTSDIQPRSGMQVRYTVSDAAGSDFLASSEEGSKNSSLIFSGNGSGQYAATISIPITADNDEEPNGSVKVVLNSPASSASGSYTVASTVGADTATVSVTDNDDDVPELSISGGSSVTEGDPGDAAVNAVFTVTSDILPDSALSVGYTVSEPSGNNFLVRSVEGAKTRSLSFSNNGSGQFTTTISIPINPDNIDEANSSVKVVLSSPTGVQVGTYAVSSTVGADTATVSVVDDDVPVLSVSGGSSVTEVDPGGSAVNAVFTFTSDIRSRISIPVRYTVSDATGSDFLASAQEGAKTASLRFTVNGNGRYTSAISIPITADNVDESNGSVKVVLNSPASSNSGSYTVASTVGADTATVSVSDDDVPVISVERWRASEPEGNYVYFRLRKNTGGRIDVDYTVTEEGDFIIDKSYWSTNKSNFIASNRTYSSWISVPTHQDTIDESDGSITFTVLTDQNGNDYTRHTTNYTATTTVIDNDNPVISVVRQSASVSEGGDVNFKLVKGTTGDQVAVDYTVSESGDFISSKSSWTGNKSWTIASNRTETDWIAVQTVQDTIDENHGSITFTVLTDQSGTDYVRHASNHTATVTVNDDDPSVLSVSGGASVTEGDPGDPAVNAMFTVASDIQPAGLLSVRYTVSDVMGSDFLAGAEEGSKTRSLSFSSNGSGQYTAAINIPITADNDQEADGSVKVVLNSSASNDSGSYTVSSTVGADTATVSVVDDDKPIISVESQVTSVTEGTNALFRLHKNTTGGGSWVFVDYTITEVGDFIRNKSYWTGDRSNSIASDKNYSLWISIPTNQDSIDENHGSVTLTLLTDQHGNDYTKHETNHTATVTVNDDDNPTISVMSQATSVNEGGDVKFKLVKSTTGDQVSVDYTVSELGDFISNKSSWTGNKSRTIASTRTATNWFVVQLDQDRIDESSGSVTLTVLADQSGTDYTRHATNHTATVTVNDDDKPVISVVSLASSVTEGRDVKFKLVKGTTGDRVSVDYTVSESGDFIRNKSSWTGNKSRTIASTRTATNWFVVQLDQDRMDESSGSVTLTVLSDQSGNDYTRHVMNHTATVTIIDDDKPVISVVRQSASLTEGGIAKFRFTMRTAGTEVWVDYNVTESGDFISDKSILSENRREKIASGSTRSDWVSIGTDQDTTDEGQGSITLTLLPDDSGVEYDKHRIDYTADITVNDDDVPELSIDDGVSVMEGATEMMNGVEVPIDAKFMVTVENGITIGTDRTIHYTVNETSGDFVALAGEGSKTAIWHANEPSLAIPVAIQDNDMYEGDGTVQVTLTTGGENDVADYTLDQTNFAATTQVMEEEVRTVSISKYVTVDGERVTKEGKEEGSKFKFTLHSNFIPTDDITVTISVCISNVTIDSNPVRNGENFVTDGASCKYNDTVIPKTVTISKDSDNASFLVGTEGNNAVNTFEVIHRVDDKEYGDHNGTITVELVSASYLQVPIAIGRKGTGVTVVDDELPFLTIEANDVMKNQGEDMTFTIKSSKRATRNLEISYHVFQWSFDPLNVHGLVADFLERIGTNLARYDDTVTLPAGEKEVQITVKTGQDESIEHMGSVDPVLNLPEGNAGYTVGRDRNQRVIWTKVIDRESGAVKPSVSIVGNNASIDEGESAVFTLSARLDDEDVDLRMSVCVKLTKTDGVAYRPFSSHFGDSSTIRIDNEHGWLKDLKNKGITAPAELYCAKFDNSSTTTLTIPTAGDEVPEVHGSITATLYDKHGLGYAKDSENSTASINILDNDAPEISIRAKTSSPVTEGANAAEFTVTASRIVQEDMTVYFDVDPQSFDEFASANFLATPIPNSVIIPRNTRNATLSLPIENDEVDEHNGYIKVTVKTPDNGNAYNVGSNNVARIKFMDDEEDRKISIAAASTEIAEGDSANFILTAKEKDTGKLAGLGKSVILKLSEVPGVDYIDFDTLNEIEPKGPKSGFFAAGESSVERSLDGRLSGRYFSLDGKKGYVVVFDGGNTATFALPTVDDDVYEADGSVEVLVYDREAENEKVGYSADDASDSVTLTFNNNDFPTISLEGVDETVNESAGMVSYTIRSSDELKSNLSVRISLTQESGNFLGRAEGADPTEEITATMNTGNVTQTFRIRLDDDDTYQAEGRIRIAIQKGENDRYELDMDENNNPINNVATVTIKDDEVKPTISIEVEEENEYALEGGHATFKITASVGFDDAIKINFSPYSKYPNLINNSELPGSDTGCAAPEHFLTISWGLRCVLLAAGSMEILLNIDTNTDNSPADPAGSYKRVTAEILPGGAAGTDYNISGSLQNEHIYINENHWPRISVALGSRDSFRESSDLKFDLTITGTKPNSVEYYVTQMGDFLVNPGENTADISESDSFFVQIDDDLEFERHGSVSLELVPRPGYIVENGSVDDVLVEDYDNPDGISILAVTDEIKPGDTAWFEIVLHEDYVLGGVAVLGLSSPSSTESLVHFELSDISMNDAGIQVKDLRMNSNREKWSLPSNFVKTATSDEIITIEVLTYKRITKNQEAPPSTYNSASVTVRVPPTMAESPVNTGALVPEISIIPVSGTATEGEDVMFTLSSNGVPARKIDVFLELSQSGDFIDGSLDRTVQMNSNGEGTLVVNTADDSQDEPDGSITARILPYHGYTVAYSSDDRAIVHILDNDLSDAQRREQIADVIRSIQPRITSSLTEKTRSAVESRIQQAFDGSSGSSLALGGNSSLTDLVKLSGESVNDGDVSLKSIIGESSFLLELFPEEGIGNPLTVWGIGDYQAVVGTGDADSFSWGGNMIAGQIGFDMQMDQELLLGLTSSLSEAEVEYATGSNFHSQGVYHSRMSSIHPYFGWVSLDDDAEVQGSVGYGTGEIRVSQNGYAPEVADSSIATLSIAGAKTLYSKDDMLWNGRGVLKVKGDTWVSRQFVHENDSLIDNMQFDDNHALIATESSLLWKLRTGSTVSPELLLGLERDGGNGKANWGSAAGSKISYSNPIGLAVSGLVNAPLAGDVRDWGWHGSLEYDSDSDGLGTVLNATSNWGEPGFATHLLSGNNTASNADTIQQSSNPRFGLEMGYGLQLFNDGTKLSPYSSIAMTGNTVDEFELGSRMKSETNTSLGLSWTRGFQSDGNEYRMNFSGDFKW